MIADNDIALDPLQQARKRLQQLAATVASGSLGKNIKLSKMASDLFSCPVMSAKCERVFSQTENVITDEYNRLQSDTVAAVNGKNICFRLVLYHRVAYLLIIIK